MSFGSRRAESITSIFKSEEVRVRKCHCRTSAVERLPGPLKLWDWEPPAFALGNPLRFTRTCRADIVAIVVKAAP